MDCLVVQALQQGSEDMHDRQEAEMTLYDGMFVKAYWELTAAQISFADVAWWISYDVRCLFLPFDLARQIICKFGWRWKEMWSQLALPLNR